ncbi:MAG: 5'/3'-nucleotidase SurE [Fimbriimonadales bacterium]
MRILLTNDDGIHATGLKVLAEVASEFGEVVVCAPDRERSACGHSMTLRDPLRLTQVADVAGQAAFQVNGLPVDCINLGLHELIPDCDLVLSGINNGPNLGWDSTYSGTVGGALEGSVNGIRSVALSVAKYVEEAPAHFETAATWLRENWAWLTTCPMNPHTILSVNVPSIAWLEVRGTSITHMGKRTYTDRVEKRSDPWGRPYFWQGGVVITGTEEEGSDVNAVSNGFVSVTPIRMDWTDHGALEALRKHLMPPAEPKA